MFHRLLVLILLIVVGTVSAQENETYVVNIGDSLREIAEEFDVNLICLMDSNGIPNPSFITPGQELVIPAACPPFGNAATTTEEEVDDFDFPADEELPPDEEELMADVIVQSDIEDDIAALGQGGGIAEDTDLEARYYTVQFGDSLGRIAARFSTTVDCLIQSNDIADPDLIYSGQRLFISPTCQPDGQGGGIANEGASTTLDPDRVCRGDRNPGRTTTNGVYIVQAGDMLDFIGCDFGLQTACLSEVNNLDPPGEIEIGQSLVIDFSCPAWDGPPGPGDLGN